MTDHVAVLRAFRDRFGWAYGDEGIAAIDHAIAACEQHAALVARLGELEKGWRNKQPLLGACRATADYQQVADDLARVVKADAALQQEDRDV